MTGRCEGKKKAGGGFPLRILSGVRMKLNLLDSQFPVSSSIKTGWLLSALHIRQNLTEFIYLNKAFIC